MRNVLLSINPKWCEKILNGKKTIEIRKTKPKCELPFKVYIYCTKASARNNVVCGSHIVINDDELFKDIKGKIKYGCSIELMAEDGDTYTEHNFYNGKVVGEFVCFVEKRTLKGLFHSSSDFFNFSKKSCLPEDSKEFILNYANGKDYIYAWHISDLVVYDELKELNTFYKSCGENPMCDGCEYLYIESNESVGSYSECTSSLECFKPLKRAPRSWGYVEKGDDR